MKRRILIETEAHVYEERIVAGVSISHCLEKAIAEPGVIRAEDRGPADEPKKTVCIQCSMEALLRNESPALITDSPEDHMRRVHYDLNVTKRRRIELEKLLAEKYPVRF